MSFSTSREKGTKIRLRSSDGKEFVVEPAVAELSGTIKLLMEDGFDDIPLPNVQGKVLAQVIEYSTKHARSAAESKSALKEWDKKFIERVNKWSLLSFFGSSEEPLFDLIRAAHYLEVTGLLDLTTQTIANIVTEERMSVRELRWMFNVKNDLTRRELKEIRQEHVWAFKNSFCDFTCNLEAKFRALILFCFSAFVFWYFLG